MLTLILWHCFYVTLIRYLLSFSHWYLKYIHFQVIVLWMMHDLFLQFAPCSSSTVPNSWINTFLENWKLTNLTNPFQTPAFSLGPAVIRRDTCCYWKAPRVPPREVYVLFVKYYFMTFVSKKNKCCSHWSAWLAAVCSRKANKCLPKLKTAGYKSDKDKKNLNIYNLFRQIRCVSAADTQ